MWGNYTVVDWSYFILFSKGFFLINMYKFTWSTAVVLEVLLLFQLLDGVDEVASSKSPLTLLEGEAMRRLLVPIEKVPEIYTSNIYFQI